MNNIEKAIGNLHAALPWPFNKKGPLLGQFFGGESEAEPAEHQPCAASISSLDRVRGIFAGLSSTREDEHHGAYSEAKKAAPLQPATLKIFS